MNPQEAHDIVNKDINVILKETTNQRKISKNLFKQNRLSQLNKSYKKEDALRYKLKGIISIEASEIERWEELRNLYDIYNHQKNGFKEGNCVCHVCENIKALKISIEDLKEKVK